MRLNCSYSEPCERDQWQAKREREHCLALPGLIELSICEQQDEAGHVMEIAIDSSMITDSKRHMQNQFLYSPGPAPFLEHLHFFFSTVHRSQLLLNCTSS